MLLRLAIYTGLAGVVVLGGPVRESGRLAPLVTPSKPGERLYEALAGSGLLDEADLSGDWHVVPDSYIVMFDNHVNDQFIEDHQATIAEVNANDVVYAATGLFSSTKISFDGIKRQFNIGAGDKTARGYTGKFSANTLDRIRGMPGVKYVEKDSLVAISEKVTGPWGLARISHRDPLTFRTFNKYEFDARAGKDVDVYIIDTGINVNHVELQGRARWGATMPDDEDRDLNGHGSHVAGTVASRAYGVAKAANVIAVKVLGANGSGTMSDVVNGVAFAADSALEELRKFKAGKRSAYKGSVANMSLGGGKSVALDDAVNAAVESGLHFAVAAGNDNRDACSYSPASAELAITVGASTISDERAYFSNHGKCVDVFAPGLNIQSIWIDGDRSMKTISGTSMASPHVAGLAAYFLSLYPENFSVHGGEEGFAAEDVPMWKEKAQMVFDKLAPTPNDPRLLTPKQLKQAMIRLGSRGLLEDLPKGTPNVLVYNNYTNVAFR